MSRPLKRKHESDSDTSADDVVSGTPPRLLESSRRKNWPISPEVRAKIMTGRIFAEVQDEGDWPDFGFQFWASKWPELNELLDDEEGLPKDTPEKNSAGTRMEQESLQALSWMEWDFMLQDYLRGLSCYQAGAPIFSVKESISGEGKEEAEAGGSGSSGGKGDIRRWTMDDFRIGKRLGKGAFGTVYMAMERKSEYVVALKGMEKRMIERRNCSLQIQREMEIQFHLLHRNIGRLYDYFHDDQHVYLILEYAPNGTLGSLLKSQEDKRLAEPECARFLHMLSSALAYIHGMDIIHRDIKPDNLLLGYGNILKLADFGWAVQGNVSSCTAFCGTEEYLAPEMVKRQRVTTQLDMWSAGVVLYEMLFGRTPFRGATRPETFRNILSGECGWPRSQPRFELAKKLVKGLLRQEPTKRMAATKVLQNEWLNQFIMIKKQG